MTEPDRHLEVIADYMRARGDASFPAGLIEAVKKEALRPAPIRDRSTLLAAFRMRGVAAITGGLVSVVTLVVLLVVVGGLPVGVADGQRSGPSRMASPATTTVPTPGRSASGQSVAPRDPTASVEILDATALQALASVERTEPLVVVADARIVEGEPRRGPACMPGTLDGTPCHLGAIVGSDAVIHISAHWVATSENTNGAQLSGPDTWAWWALPALPIDGPMVLSIMAPNEVVFLGRLRAVRGEWVTTTVSDALLTDLGLDEVVLVDGWLGGFGTVPITCAPPAAGDEPLAGLPSRRCHGGASFLMHEPSDLRPADGLAVPEGAIRVQNRAYEQYAAEPAYTVEEGLGYVAGVGIPRRGVYVLANRLQGDGCASPPCPAWEVVGRIEGPE